MFVLNSYVFLNAVQSLFVFINIYTCELPIVINATALMNEGVCRLHHHFKCYKLIGLTALCLILRMPVDCGFNFVNICGVN